MWLRNRCLTRAYNAPSDVPVKLGRMLGRSTAWKQHHRDHTSVHLSVLRISRGTLYPRRRRNANFSEIFLEDDGHRREEERKEVAERTRVFSSREAVEELSQLMRLGLLPTDTATSQM